LRIEVSVVRRSGEVREVDDIGPAPRAAVCTVTRRESTDTSGSSWRRVTNLGMDGTAVHRPGGRAVPPVTPRRPGESEQGAEQLLGEMGRIEPDFHPLECFGFPRVNCLPQPGCQSRSRPPG
jgi:hypothetical protein